MATTRPITHRQMRAAEIWVRDGCKSKGKALREADYSKSVVRHPKRVFDSPAFLEELNKRGVNEYGMRGRMSWENEDETIPVRTISEFDVAKIPEGQIAWLKEQLEKLPTPNGKREENHSYIPIGGGVDILNDSSVQPERQSNLSSFSAM